MNKTKQKGFTLMEMLMVISVMTLISIVAMKDRITETKRLKAKTLGTEIGYFAKGLTSYVGYYAGIDPSVISPIAPGSPTNNQVTHGVNFLKSNSCSIPSETSSTGSIDIGFISNCSFLSHSNPSKNQRTRTGNLSFKTTFKRTNSGIPSKPAKLEAITVIDTLSDAKGRPDTGSMGLAAIVANGLNVNGASNSNYSVYYCASAVGGTSEYRALCNGNPNKIVLKVSNDSSSSPWLETNGSNTMNAAITFNPGITDDLKSIKNIAQIILQDKGTVTPILRIKDKAQDIIQISKDRTKFVNGSVEVSQGDINVKKGNIIADEKDIIARKGNVKVENGHILAQKGKVFSNHLQSNTRFRIDLNTDGKSELNNIGVTGIYFAPKNNNRDSTGAHIKNINSARDDLEIRADTLKFEGTVDDKHTNFTGKINLNNTEVLLQNNRYRKFADLLPRYTFLGAQKIKGSGYVFKSNYTKSCEQQNLKIIANIQASHVRSAVVNEAAMLNINEAINDVMRQFPGFKQGSFGYTTSQIDRQSALGSFYAKVTDWGTLWYVRAFTPNAGGRNYNRFTGTNTNKGTVLAQVYCLNKINGASY